MSKRKIKTPKGIPSNLTETKQESVSVILTKDPDDIGNILRIDWRKIYFPILLILKNIQKLFNAQIAYY
jgi:hypothetical protein